MADLGSDGKRIAQLLRMLGSSGGERRNAFAALERLMQSAGISWTDIGDVVENFKYTEADLQEYGQVQREEGVEAGIKVGMSRRHNGSSNGHLTLPLPAEMADYCRTRLGRMRDQKQREFIDEMYLKTQRGMTLQLGPLGYLASIYIKLGGRA